MALSFCYAYPWISTKFHCVSLLHGHRPKNGLDARFPHSPQSFSTELFGKHVLGAEVMQDWSFMGGHRITIRPKIDRCINLRKSSGVCHSCKPPLSEMTRLAGLSNSQIASSVFTLGTAAVLPFYTLMLAAPKAELTKKTMRSSLPYVALGLLYGYLLCLSWTPDTIRLMFASKYWLPELQGIAKMFSSEMTLASAWIHLLVVDLFAARQVYHDGLENEVETRHSVAMCLLFCPIGIISHAITKGMTNTSEKTKHNDSPI